MQQLQTTLKSEHKQIVTYIHDILPQFPAEAGQATRQTRAVFPFLGTALNWLAGVALDDDIAAMRGHMSTIKKQQIILMGVLQKQNDDLSSYMHTANNRQDTLSAGLTTRLTRLQPRAPDFLGAPERPHPRKASMSSALCVKSVKSWRLYQCSFTKYN